MNLIKRLIMAGVFLAVSGSSLWATGPFPGSFERRQALIKINPSVVYVNHASRADHPDGSSWALAFPSLCQALKSDLKGKKEIWVAQGTYYPTDTLKRSESFALVPGIGVYGGFKGHELLRSQRDWSRYQTILSGEIGDPGLLTDNSYHVVTGANDAVIDGMIIRDGYALSDEGQADDSPSLIPVSDQKAGTLSPMPHARFPLGGGLLNLYGAIQVRNCRFLSNYAVKGGGVYTLATRYRDPENMAQTVTAKASVFENCIFEDNHALAGGGAVASEFYTRTTLTTCVFANNSSEDKGGAVYADLVSPVYLINVLFSNNEARRGAALAAQGGSSHRMVFTTFVGNMAYDTGAAIYQGEYSQKQAQGHLFTGNEAHLYRSFVISNVSLFSPASICNWHDSRVTYDAESVVESVDGTINGAQYLTDKTFASKTAEAGFHPSRTVDIDYWTGIFDGDVNRTYTGQVFDTSGPAGRARTIYVDDDAPAGGDGSSWARAFSDLTLALEHAGKGSQIWVAKGVYAPTTGVDRNTAFVMKEGVKLYGGFGGSESSLEDRDWAVNITVLSGDIGKKLDMTDNCYHVVYGASDCLLDGFVVKGGRADGDFDQARGGGLLCADTACPRIANTIFESNEAHEGGAIACTGAAALILENCIISRNTAELGGGMLFRAGPDGRKTGARLFEVQFLDNIAHSRGGAVYIDSGARPGFKRCTLSGNRSTGNGGSVYVDSHVPEPTNQAPDFNACVLTENTTGLRGGAFAIYEGAVLLRDTLVTHNTASAGGGGIALDYTGQLINRENTAMIQENTSSAGRPDIDNAATGIAYRAVSDATPYKE